MVQEPRAQCRGFHDVTHLQRAQFLRKSARLRQLHKQGIERAHSHNRLLHVTRIAEKPQSFFNYALERDFLLVGLEPYRREKANKLLAHEALEVLHPDLGTLVILRDNKNRARFLEKSLSHHHGG